MAKQTPSPKAMSLNPIIRPVRRGVYIGMFPAAAVGIFCLVALYFISLGVGGLLAEGLRIDRL